METKYLKVKEKKVDDTIDFYASFGWVLSGEKEELPNGKVGLTFERDKHRLEGDYRTVRRGERVYRQIARPFPLAALITLAIGCAELVLYFTVRDVFAYYIVFLYGCLTFYAITVYLLIIFVIILVKRRSLLNKLVYNVGLQAGTLRDYPLQNNILEEEDDTWAIAENL